MAQVWLITGASRGLGRALAEAVLAAGHRLVATARGPASSDDLVARWGDHVLPLALDVTDPRAADEAVRKARRVERLARRFVCEPRRGQFPELFVDEGQQHLRCGRFPSLATFQEF